MGSFPLTRGKHLLEREGVIGAGLIPAHAGKTTRRSPPSWTHRAHPRSRGENSPQTSVRVTSPGSSPLTRGKRSRRSSTDRDKRAHPRSRGENAPPSPWRDQPAGSSPLTRGKRVIRSSDSRGRRLIPAHAGKTSTSSDQTRPPGAHPRSRGENVAGVAAPGVDEGSSPLTRGKLAGAQRRGRRELAHPRSRGENLWQDWRTNTREGSSPLTRGKPQARCEGQRGHGLIPAHAGKTLEGLQARHMRWAHPRSRGENGCPAAGPPPMRGSSPLTRGKRGARVVRRVSERLIPAHAGKTSKEPPTFWKPRAHPRSRGENPPTVREDSR